MSRYRTAWMLGAVVALAATVFLLPVAADWLVTKDDDRIETDGPWEVKSRLVVFKRPDGTFASMRLSEIDLEESERLTREMAEEARRPEPRQREARSERREPIARLTEKDLPPVRSQSPEDGEDGREVAGESERSANEDRGAPAGLTLASWREVTEVDAPGVGFTGEIRNPTEFMAIGVTVTITLFDEEDEELEATRAVLTSDALPPGRTAGFRAMFDGVFDYARADFDVSGDLLRADSGEPQEADQPAEG